MMNQYNRFHIFINYRYGTEGAAFAMSLYKYLKNHVSAMEFDRVFCFPETTPLHNFKTDIDFIMRDTAYFILPLTTNYFTDYIDADGNVRKYDFYSYYEIRAAIRAIKANTDRPKIIRVLFPGYQDDQLLLQKIFSDDSFHITSAQTYLYSEETKSLLFRELIELMLPCHRLA